MKERNNKKIKVSGLRMNRERLAKEADSLLRELFPICRSITGDGVRKTLKILNEAVRFDIKEIPSHTACYDWTIPEEWNIKDAFIKDSKGRKIIDFSENNLHLVSYSIPVNKKVSFAELEKHLHYLPKLPAAIPYRTAYYYRDWGFCLAYRQFQKLDRSEQYHVFIDSSLSKGSLTYAEELIKGSSGKEYLISTYCCHPSLANDNLSGQVLWALLLRELKKRKTRHSYRFLIAPETIGAIAYLSRNEKAMKKISGGFLITTVAGPGKFGYKHTYLGDHLIDRAVKKTFEDSGIGYLDYPFDINGSDEKQYASPYFRIPVGTICKDKYFEYDYYHTSFDNLDFISAGNLLETLELYLSAIEILEMDVTYRSLNPYCCPMLGKRGLYPKIGGDIRQKVSGKGQDHNKELDMISWVMFYSDGKTSTIDISEKIGFTVKQIYETAEKLKACGLLAECGCLKKRR